MKRELLLFGFSAILWFISPKLSAQVVQQEAVYSITTDTVCAEIQVYGNFQGLLKLTPAENVTLRVMVSAPGSYLISTDRINGYQFSAKGEFLSSGPQTVQLLGRGIPNEGQIDRFTVTASGGGGKCTFSIIAFSWNCNKPFTDVRDSQNYRTVLMDNQCWMAQNLNIGIQISSLRNQKNNGETEKFCYNGNEGNCRIYGGLYQWDELMQYTTKPGAQGLCPAGWHIPTDEEWCKLTKYVDPTVNCDAVGVSGTNCGGKLKESETAHWASPNVGATNSSEFAGLPTGYRDYPGSFNNLPYEAFFWTSTECSEAHAWNRGLHYYDGDMSRDDYVKSNGFSARCIRN